MRRSMRLLALLLMCLLAQFLIGCNGRSNGTASPVPSTPNATRPIAQFPPLTTVDWANFTYYSSCYGNHLPFHVVNGTATNNGIQLRTLQAVYGDLTGDGQPEVAIPYICTGADFGGERVFVYTGNAEHPILMGDLPTNTGAGANTFGSVMTVAIMNGLITLSGVGYGPGEPRCCPGLQITSSYRWDGSRFVMVSDRVVSLTATPTTK